jgi:hypothetical protein
MATNKLRYLSMQIPADRFPPNMNLTLIPANSLIGKLLAAIDGTVTKKIDSKGNTSVRISGALKSAGVIPDEFKRRNKLASIPKWGE